MLYEEAKWIGEQLLKLCKPNSRLLNVGSSTLYSRTVVQPHMEDFIFRPLREINVEVIHTDLQDADGVDIVGDLTDENFIAQLKSLKFDCILCSNLLEHIEDINPVIAALEEITPKNGYNIITVPYIYPYHLDPIDTLYRPTVNDLKIHFKNLKYYKGLILTAKRMVNGEKQKNYFEMLINSPELAIRLLIRSFLPFYKYQSWKRTINDLLKMFKPFQVTCVVFKKE